MDPPPPPLSTTVAGAAASAGHLNYPDSADSSPRSRNADPWDDPPLPSAAATAKLRLMCSYGGHIIPRPHDKSLCYVGGDTRIVVVDRLGSLADLHQRLSKTLLNNRPFTLKYQLPNEDLDSLISVTTDEDFDNMADEYDRLAAAAGKSSRLRLFLFPAKPDSASSIGSLLEDSTKSEDWFVNALNGANSVFSESASANCLLCLDDDVAGNSTSPAKDAERRLRGVGGNSNKMGSQDFHSVPDSPMLETTSSFGSTSSSPLLANLPPIRVRAEDQKPPAAIEEQFSQIGVGPGPVLQKQEDLGFVVLTSPPPVQTTVAEVPPTAIAALPSEYPPNRVFSDDERSEQGYRKLPQSQPQIPQSQPKPTGGIDLASPDSVSSDSSITNPLSRQRPPLIYQDPVFQNFSGNNWVDPKLSDPNSRLQMQQLQDSGYILQNQFDQQNHQLNQQHQQQQQQQQQQLNHQQQQQQQQQLNQQQQFLQAGTHFVHQHPTGPIPSYYPLYAPQQQSLHGHHPLDQSYPMYYLQARPPQAYNLPVQQPNYSENATNTPSSRPQTPPPSSMMAPPSAYTTARNAQPLVQASSGQPQPQYVGFSHIHPHPSQSGGPASAAMGNYGYELVDPMHAQMYYTPPMARPQLAAQYQTMTSTPGIVLPESADNTKHQIRTSQP